ncbi:MAG: L-2-hydroxyglutarate oxidase [Saprospiraceae bacterium]
MKTYDALIIGGGIVGLATAFRLLEIHPDWKLVVLEKESSVAAHQTSHNSGVIHSGIYYKPGSQKSRLCQVGYHQLINFCDQQGIDYEVCGKVIVATDENDLPQLRNIQDRGKANGLTGIEWWPAERTLEREPHVAVKAALFVPQAGIIQFAQVAERFAKIVGDKGGAVQTGCQVTNIVREERSILIETNKETYRTKLAISCGGLWADRLARMSEKKIDLRILPFRGEYYALKPQARHLVNHLIYPVPNPALPFLGVHFTRRITGVIDVGPSAVIAWSREGYRRADFSWRDVMDWAGFSGSWRLFSHYWKIGFDEYHRSFSKKAFIQAARQLIPELQVDDVESAPAGVRAQAIRDTGQLEDDFRLFSKPGLVHVVNAPSPAATSSLAIGSWIAQESLKAKMA